MRMRTVGTVLVLIFQQIPIGVGDETKVVFFCEQIEGVIHNVEQENKKLVNPDHKYDLHDSCHYNQVESKLSIKKVSDLTIGGAPVQYVDLVHDIPIKAIFYLGDAYLDGKVIAANLYFTTRTPASMDEYRSALAEAERKYGQ